MPLNKIQLEAAIKGVFDQADSEKDPLVARGKIAQGLAEAVHAYVAAADVADVTVTVRDPGNIVIGTGTQTGKGKLE